MPYKSDAQRRYMFWAESQGKVRRGTAEEWAHETPNIKSLPERVSKKKKKACYSGCTKMTKKPAKRVTKKAYVNPFGVISASSFALMLGKSAADNFGPQTPPGHMARPLGTPPIPSARPAGPVTQRGFETSQNPRMPRLAAPAQQPRLRMPQGDPNAVQQMPPPGLFPGPEHDLAFIASLVGSGARPGGLLPMGPKWLQDAKDLQKEIRTTPIRPIGRDNIVPEHGGAI